MNTTTTKRDPAKKLLIQMLTENTGQHFLDSGGAYGRNWERNQGKDFEASPASYWDITDFTDKDGKEMVEFSVRHDLYHWLADKLAVAPKLDAILQRWMKRADKSHCEAVNEFPGYLFNSRNPEYRLKVTGLYSDELQENGGGNTCNSETALTQDFMYNYFEIDGTSYVVISVHGGCDIRGGYSTPHVFEVCDVNGGDGDSFFDFSRVSVMGCKPKADPSQLLLPGWEEIEAKLPDRIYWDSDNGGYSYSYGGDGFSNVAGLDEYMTTTDPTLRGQGWTYIDVENNKVYCPITGWELCPYSS